MPSSRYLFFTGRHARPARFQGRRRPGHGGSCGLPGIIMLCGLGFFAVSAAGAWDRWHIPEADCRLRLGREENQNRAFVLRADLPEAWRNGGVHGATTSQGSRLQTRPVRQGDTLVAVEIAIPAEGAEPPNLQGMADATGFPDPNPVFLYLSRQPGSGAAAESGARRVMAVYKQADRSITRPSTAANMLVFHARQKPLIFYRDVAPNEWSEIPRRVARTEAQRRTPRAEVFAERTLCSTVLRLDQPGEYRFGAEGGESAWYVYVNGQPAGSWMEAEDMGGGAMLGARTTLDAGLHTLDFIVMSRLEESPPGFVWLPPGGTVQDLPVELLVSPHHPTAVRMEFRDGPGNPGIAGTAETLLLPKLGGQLTLAKVADLSLDDKGKMRQSGFSGGGEPVKGGGLLGFRDKAAVIQVHPPGETTPFSFRLPGPPRANMTIVMAEIFFGHLPVTTEWGDVIRTDLQMHAPPERLLQKSGAMLTLKIELRDREGRVYDTTEHPWRRTDRPIPVEIPVDSRLRRVEATPLVGGYAVAPGAALTILHPRDDLADLRAAGGRLVLGRDSVVLCPVPAERAEEPPPPSRHPLPRDARIAWVDTYVNASAGFPDAGDHGRPAAAEPHRLTSLNVDVARKDSSLPELWAFDLAREAFGQSPDAIVWGIGVQELQAGVEEDEVLRRAAFLIQASLARGILPVVMTPPLLRDMDYEATRSVALSLKRMGLRDGFPICDIYSGAHALASRPGQPAFSSFSECGESGVGLLGFNAAGQEWIRGRIAQALGKGTGEW